MNERIRALAEQANEAFYQRMGEGAERGTFYFDGFAEKFAELIVKECAEQIQLQKNRVHANVEYKRGHTEASDDAVEIIKYHFGVE